MRLADDGSRAHALILEAFAGMARFVEVMDVTGEVPSLAEALVFRDSAAQFSRSYAALNEWSTAAARRLFPITPKFHMFLHMARAAKHLNPKYHWCFKAEDYVGRISRIAASVAHGVKSTKISLKLADKYRHLLHLRLKRPVFDDL